MTNAARRMLGSFDIKPTTAPAGQKPDELMLDCTTLPKGSRARLYMAGISADEILAAAGAIHGYQPFERIDDHTIGFAAPGVLYVPIPRAPGNIAGLMDVTLPADVRVGDRFIVAVTQLTNRSALIATAPRFDSPVVGPSRQTQTIAWRTPTGTYQLALKVKSELETLPLVAQELSILRWIFEAVPVGSRWRTVVLRYLGALVSQVSALGGNPDTIAASSSGTLDSAAGSDGTGPWTGQPWGPGGGSAGAAGSGATGGSSGGGTSPGSGSSGASSAGWLAQFGSFRALLLLVGLLLLAVAFLAWELFHASLPIIGILAAAGVILVLVALLV